MKLLLRFHYEDEDWLLVDEGHDDEYQHDRFQVVPANSATGQELRDAIPEIKP